MDLPSGGDSTSVEHLFLRTCFMDVFHGILEFQKTYYVVLYMFSKQGIIMFIKEIIFVLLVLL